jgi:hypothetical protein
VSVADDWARPLQVPVAFEASHLGLKLSLGRAEFEVDRSAFLNRECKTAKPSCEKTAILN